MDELRFDLLTDDDLEAAVALSTEAGWNQTPADWRRLLELAPGGCLAGRVGGRLVATTTVVGYQPVRPTPVAARWIGMVLVARAWRRRGFGTAMLRHALATVAEPHTVGLDATDLGRPLYLGLGFVDVAPFDRWAGRLRAVAAPARPAITLQRLDPAALDEAVALDRRACGLDRSLLLRRLATEHGTSGWLARAGDRPVGLACLRPGREHWHLGPVVAEDSAVLAAVLNAAAGQLPAASVLVEAPRIEPIAALLAAAGLRVHRRLTRMTRPGRRPLLLGDTLAAATALEWG
jgi:GNAT superfamily N-acetyltransferase